MEESTSTTEQPFVATVEVGTKSTSAGVAAELLWERLNALEEEWWADRYLRTLEVGLHQIGDPFPYYSDHNLAEVIANYVCSRDVALEADYGYGVFEGAVSPNVRFSLAGFCDAERELFLAIISKGLRQAAAAASRFALSSYQSLLGELSHGEQALSLYVEAYRPPTYDEVHALFEALGCCFPFNVQVVPTGFVVDFLPMDGLPSTILVARAVRAVFNPPRATTDLYRYVLLERLWTSTYIESDTYETIITEYTDDAPFTVGQNVGRYPVGDEPGRQETAAGIAFHGSNRSRATQDRKVRRRSRDHALAAAQEAGQEIDQMFQTFVFRAEAYLKSKHSRSQSNHQSQPILIDQDAGTLSLEQIELSRNGSLNSH